MARPTGRPFVDYPCFDGLTTHYFTVRIDHQVASRESVWTGGFQNRSSGEEGRSKTLGM